MGWRAYIWPCAFFLLMGIMVGMAGGVVASRYQRLLFRLPVRVVTSARHIQKSSPPASTPSPAAEVPKAPKSALPAPAPKPPKKRAGVLTLASFEKDGELSLFEDSEGRLERTREQATQGRYALKVTFPDGGGSLSAWRTLPRNWSGYKRLQFDVCNPQSTVPFSLFIKDSKHTSYRQGYNQEQIRLGMGCHSIEIPLAEVARKINLRDVVQLRIFLWKVPGQHVLFFDNFRLSRGNQAVAETTYQKAKEVSSSKPFPPPPPVVAASDSSPPSVWVVGESYKIRPDKGTPFNPSVKRDLRRRNEVWDGARKVVTLHGARNEYVGFQLIIEARDKPLGSVTVLPTDLVGPSTIPRSHIQLFREHYIKVDKPSDQPRPSTGPGEYPDPLVPLDLPKVGGPFDVPVGRNQAVWVDIYIPESVPAGLYKGKIEISGVHMDWVSLTVQLKVWDFTLPRESALTFWANYHELPRGFDVIENSRDYQAVERELWQLSHRHRITALLRYAPINPRYTGSGRSLKVDWTAYDLRVGPYLDGTLFKDGVKPNLFLLPITYYEGTQWPPGDDETFFQMCKAFARHFDAKGWDLSKTLIFLGVTPEEKEFSKIKRLARLVRQADPRFKTTVAFDQFSAETLQGFAGLIDLWMVKGHAYSPSLLTPREAKGEWRGFYQQSEPFLGNVTLDADGLALRTWPWIAWKYRVDVIYLYSMTEWRLWRKEQNPWVNSLNREEGRGHGVLLYPGRHIGTRRVIGSIRMKQVRRGMQDYQYFTLAKAAGADPTSVVDSIIRRALGSAGLRWGSPGQWDRDPARWLEARKQLAALILERQSPRSKVATHAPPAQAPARGPIMEEPARFFLESDFERGTLDGWVGGEVQEEIVHHGRYALRATPKQGSRFQSIEVWRRFPATSKTVLKFAYYTKGADWVKVQFWSQSLGKNLSRLYEDSPEAQWQEVTLPLSSIVAPRGGKIGEGAINSVHFAIPNRPGAVLVVDDVVLVEDKGLASLGEMSTVQPAQVAPRPQIIEESPRYLLRADYEGGGLEGWTGGELQKDIVHNGHYALRAVSKEGAKYQALELWREFPTTVRTILRFSVYVKSADWLKIQCFSKDRRLNFARVIDRPRESQWQEVVLSFMDLTARNAGSVVGDTINSIHFAIPNRPGALLVVDDVILVEEADSTGGGL